jgi:hypothetical protein
VVSATCAGAKARALAPHGMHGLTTYAPPTPRLHASALYVRFLTIDGLLAAIVGSCMSSQHPAPARRIPARRRIPPPAASAPYPDASALFRLSIEGTGVGSTARSTARYSETRSPSSTSETRRSVRVWPIPSTR